MTLLTVLPSQPDASGPSSAPEAQGEAALAPTRAELSHCTASLVSFTRHGDATEEIVRAAKEHPTDLIVVGSHGRSAIRRFLVGSVAERVSRHAHAPVLIVRPLSGALRRVLVGVDDSKSAERAVDWLRRLPLPDETQIRLVTIVPLLDTWTRSPIPLGPPLQEQMTTLAKREREFAQERLDALALPLTSVGRRVVTEFRSGDPAFTLLQVASEEGAELIVVGSHGQNAVEHFLIGSVSEKLVRHAECSVLVVR